MSNFDDTQALVSIKRTLYKFANEISEIRNRLSNGFTNYQSIPADKDSLVATKLNEIDSFLAKADENILNACDEITTLTNKPPNGTHLQI